MNRASAIGLRASAPDTNHFVRGDSWNYRTQGRAHPFDRKNISLTRNNFAPCQFFSVGARGMPCPAGICIPVSAPTHSNTAVLFRVALEGKPEKQVFYYSNARSTAIGEHQRGGDLSRCNRHVSQRERAIIKSEGWWQEYFGIRSSDSLRSRLFISRSQVPCVAFHQPRLCLHRR